MILHLRSLPVLAPLLASMLSLGCGGAGAPADDESRAAEPLAGAQALQLQGGLQRAQLGRERHLVSRLGLEELAQQTGQRDQHLVCGMNVAMHTASVLSTWMRTFRRSASTGKRSEEKIAHPVSGIHSRALAIDIVKPWLEGQRARSGCAAVRAALPDGTGIGYERLCNALEPPPFPE